MNNLIIAPKQNINFIQGNLSDNTYKKYIRALNRASEDGINNFFDKEEILPYIDKLKSSSKNHFICALKKLYEYQIDELNAVADIDNINQIDAIERRLNHVTKNAKIKMVKSKGDRAKMWLSKNDVSRLIGLCDIDTQEGRRDRIVLMLLVGLGLRCIEVSRVTFSDIIKQGNDYSLSVLGKGDKWRQIPLTDDILKILFDWQNETGNNQIGQHFTKRRELKSGLSNAAIYNIVNDYSYKLGIDFNPHDLRRTCSRILYDNGMKIESIQDWLGHKSIDTTRKYIGKLKPDKSKIDVIKF